MDLTTDLPPIDDCDSILVMIDRGNTKGEILIPTAKNFDTRRGRSTSLGQPSQMIWFT
jgi:hypothetical protein